MTELFRRNPTSFQSEPEIVPLPLSEVSRVRLGWSNRFDDDGLAEVLANNPGLTLWIPETREFIVGGRWRHRDEITAVLDIGARGNADRLLRALTETARSLGKRMVIASEHHESRKQQFYTAAGFELIEEILIYELPRIRLTPPRLTGLEFELVSLDDEATMEELIELDHAAFPWLWWNSDGEFENYGRTPGVEIYLGRDEKGTAVSYVGVTRFRSWGHLDRIAVLPERQGQRLGWQSVEWAVYVLGMSGARRVGLSTQARNMVSRRLYERFGFERRPSQDYCLYGHWLGEPAAM